MKTVYLVHDSQEEIAKRIEALEDTGFRVTAFRGVEELMPALEAQKPRVVLMDILIDGPHGFLACQEIREIYSAADVPVILMSGVYRGRRYRQEAIRVGAQLFLLKPIPQDDVVRAIVEVMEEAERGAVASPT